MRRRACLLIFSLLVACSAAPGGSGGFGHASVRIGGEDFEALVAETPEQRALGLGGRDSLPPQQGMLFLFDHPGRHGFWMQGMRFDIDIIWIREGRIVDLSPRVPHALPSPLPTYRPRLPADAVFEVRAGAAEAHGWRVGDAVQITRAPARR